MSLQRLFLCFCRKKKKNVCWATFAASYESIFRFRKWGGRKKKKAAEQNKRESVEIRVGPASLQFLTHLGKMTPSVP